VFDPAVYCGDREADVAMTELFGGFPRRFYDAYGEAAPLAQGYERRRPLYNLYHLLNHLNLFGAGYLGQVQGALALLLGDVL
jgi:protein-ribulosamine 3-kinase